MTITNKKQKQRMSSPLSEFYRRFIEEWISIFFQFLKKILGFFFSTSFKSFNIIDCLNFQIIVSC